MVVSHQGPAGLGELMHRLRVVLHGLFQNLVLLQHGDGALLILLREGAVTTTAIPPPLTQNPPEEGLADCVVWQEEDLAERKKATGVIWALEYGALHELQCGLDHGSL